jgi:hypothetical protein
MQKSEFTSLPPSMALGLLWDVVGGAKLATVEAPKPMMAPKFDSRISRKGGQYVWASELDVSGLRFFFERAAASAKTDSAFAEKNAKEAKGLEYWLKYRECYPDVAWSGERNRQQVKAEAPSSKPKLHDWEPRGAVAPTTATSAAKGYDDAGYPDDGSDIPF